MYNDHAGKKWIVMLALTAALTLAACGSKETAPASSGSATQAESAQESADTAPADNADAEADTADADTADEPAAASASEGGYVFEYNGLTVSVDTDIAPVLEALGEPKGYFEAASCAFEGLDKVYTYNDFEISTYPGENADMISLILLRSDIVSTPEGISIGSAASKVTEKYGEGVEESGMLVYEKGGMKLCFIIKEDKVASIEYHSTAID